MIRCGSILTHQFKERCQSGRLGRTRNAVNGQLFRGFESLSFRYGILFGYATVAQLVELRIRNAMVAGSSPVCGSFRCGFAPFFYTLSLGVFHF